MDPTTIKVPKGTRKVNAQPTTSSKQPSSTEVTETVEFTETVEVKPKPIKRPRTSGKQPSATIKQEKATGSYDNPRSSGTDSSDDEDELPTKIRRILNRKKKWETIDDEDDPVPAKKPRKTTQKIKLEGTKKILPKVKTESGAKTGGILSGLDCKPRWNDFEILQYECHLDEWVAKNVVDLFDENNTVPFIARYRKAKTGNLSADDLRHVKETIDKTHALKSRMQSILKMLEKNGKLTDSLRDSILSARNLEIVEHLYSPYKQGATRSLAERAKLLGLEPAAINILENKINEELMTYTKDGELSIKDVEKGIGHIMAHIIATDTDLLQFVLNLKKRLNFPIEIKRAQKRTTVPHKVETKRDQKDVDESKYSLYFNYKTWINTIKPHQILAINRGERLKILSVKILIPEIFKKQFTDFCKSKWIQGNRNNCKYRGKMINDAIEDSCTRIIAPLVSRELRSDLKTKAEVASLEVFSGNLKQILLAAPVKGKKILGIDPGFNQGCKLALISETGSVIGTNIVNLKTKDKGKLIIKDLLKSNSCSLIAIGNGTACRETESWIAEMISDNFFKPLDVTYTIVNEDGASVYSCGEEAKKEFPGMDPNLISAISLARRVQEPLAELVKVEPKHLGVGMYQHDLSPKRLDEALKDVVSECVSFVGVDLNTTSQCLLKYVAGLTDKRASEIIKYRETNGPFTTREQLKDVKGIGANTFQQCAGFLKVGCSPGERRIINKLDHTIIHPEAYDATLKLVKHSKLKIEDLGEQAFIATIKKEESQLMKQHEKFDVPKESLQLILEALSKPLSYDLRDDMHKPLFKKNLMDPKVRMMNSFMSLSQNQDPEEKLSKYDTIKDTMNINTLTKEQVPLLLDAIKHDLLFAKNPEFFRCARSVSKQMIRVFHQDDKVFKYAALFLTNLKQGETSNILYNITVLTAIVMAKNEEELYAEVAKKADKTQLVKALKMNVSNVALETMYKFVHFHILPRIFAADTPTETKWELVDLVMGLPLGFAYQFMSADVVKKFKEDIMERYLSTFEFDEPHHQFADCLRLCKLLIHYCGKILHIEVHLTNSIMRFIEIGFKNKSIADRCGSYECWKELILNYNLDPPFLKSLRQFKLLEKPLKANLSRNSTVAEKRFEAYACFISALCESAGSCTIEYLTFCFGPFKYDTVLVENNVAEHARGIRNIFSRSMEILLKLLGHTVENCCALKRVYVTDIYTICPVLNEHNMDTFSKVFICSVRVCSTLAKHWIQDSNQIVNCLWKSVFAVLKKIAPNTRGFVYEEIVNNVKALIKDCCIDKSHCETINLVLKSIVSFIDDAGCTRRMYNDLILPVIKELLLYQTSTEDSGVLNVDDLLDCASKDSEFLKDVDNLFETIKRPQFKVQIAVSLIKCVIGVFRKGRNTMDESPEVVRHLLVWSLDNAVDEREHIWKLVVKKQANSTCLELWVELVKALHSHMKIDPSSVSFVWKLCLNFSQLVTQSHEKLFKELVYTMATCLSFRETSELNISESLDILRTLVDAKRVHGFENLAFFYVWFEDFLKMKVYKVLPILNDYISSLMPAQRLGFSKSLISMVAGLDQESGSYSKDAQAILTQLKVPKPSKKVVQTPKSISRGAKIRNMATISPTPNPIEIPKANLIKLFEQNKQVQQLFNTAVFSVPNKTSKSPKDAGNKVKQLDNLNDIDLDRFVKIDKTITINLEKMNDHQKEVAGRRKSDIPALYEDLTQSSMDFLNLKENIVSPVVRLEKLSPEKINKFTPEKINNLSPEKINIQLNDVIKNRFNDFTGGEKNVSASLLPNTETQTLKKRGRPRKTVEKIERPNDVGRQKKKTENVPLTLGLHKKKGRPIKLFTKSADTTECPSSNLMLESNSIPGKDTPPLETFIVEQALFESFEKTGSIAVKESGQENEVMLRKEEAVVLATNADCCENEEISNKVNENDEENVSKESDVAVTLDTNENPEQNSNTQSIEGAENELTNIKNNEETTEKNIEEEEEEEEDTPENTEQTSTPSTQKGRLPKSRTLAQLKMDIVGAEEYQQNLGRRTIKRKVWKDEVYSTPRRNKNLNGNSDVKQDTPKSSRTSTPSTSSKPKVGTPGVGTVMPDLCDVTEESVRAVEIPVVPTGSGAQENVTQSSVQYKPTVASEQGSCDMFVPNAVLSVIPAIPTKQKDISPTQHRSIVGNSDEVFIFTAQPLVSVEPMNVSPLFPQNELDSANVIHDSSNEPEVKPTTTTEKNIVSPVPTLHKPVISDSCDIIEDTQDQQVVELSVNDLNSPVQRVATPPIDDTDTLESCAQDGTGTKISEMDTDTFDVIPDSTPETVVPQNKSICEMSTDTLSCSPVTNDTPIKNTELLNNTFDISPIKLVSVKAEHEIDIDDVNEHRKDDNVFAETVQTDSKPEHERITLDLPGNTTAVLLNLLPQAMLLKGKGFPELPTFASSPKMDRVKKIMLNCGGLEMEESTAQDDEFLMVENEHILKFSREVPSPFATPKISILKRKLPESAEGSSPCHKRKRVNFSDPPITCEKIYFKEVEEKSRFKTSKRGTKTGGGEKTGEATKDVAVMAVEEVIVDGIFPLPPSPERKETPSETNSNGINEGPHTVDNEINVISNIVVRSKDCEMIKPAQTPLLETAESDENFGKYFLQGIKSYLREDKFAELLANSLEENINFLGMEKRKKLAFLLLKEN